METQERGIRGVTVDDVFMGNGVSELILMALEALLERGDEVLVPAPDYPLWTAAVALTGATPVHYPCRAERGFVPDAAEVEALITPRTRALVLINPNNPTGAVYPREAVEALVRVAERHRLVLLSDEIYDRILYDGAVTCPRRRPSARAPCAAPSAGSPRCTAPAASAPAGSYFSGAKHHAGDYLEGLELLASLRLCANVPGQWAVQTALGGVQSIHDLTAETGRLGRQRRAVLRAVERSSFLKLVSPRGALYAFPGVDLSRIPDFDDARFAMELLESEHVLVVPGSSFNVPYTNHLRLTLLPDEETMTEVFVRMERLLSAWAKGGPGAE